MNSIAITGIGAVTPVGQGIPAIRSALFSAQHAFRVMRRAGRQNEKTAFLGAEIDAIDMPESFSEKLRRSISWSTQTALAAVAEAWKDAQLAAVDSRRIGLIVGGSNVQQRELVLVQDAFKDRFQFLRPSYGQIFMDTDISATCSEFFGIHGATHTVGGASASGHLAIVQAIQSVQSGQVDACIAVGALMDLSYWECQAMRNMGAMGSDKFADMPEAACRPFDRQHDGFIYGENCGAVVVERMEHARGEPYAIVRGWTYQADAHRNPDPSLAGEIRAIQDALAMGGIAAKAIDYINPHGTGSLIGDQIELEALKACGLQGAHINATKSILGHGLSAAGVVEVIATLIQMRSGMLHVTRNLEEPIDSDFSWVMHESRAHRIRNALNLSFGFGGINSAICLSNYRD